MRAAERLSHILATQRTRPPCGYTGYEPSRPRPRNSACGARAQETLTTKQTCSTCSATFTQPNHEHVALHPRFQDNMTNWMRNLINQQDGCQKIVVHQTSQGRPEQKQLVQTVARSAPSTSSTNDQVQYLRAQVAHRDAQLEHVRFERDTYFVQENCASTQQ